MITQLARRMVSFGVSCVVGSAALVFTALGFFAVPLEGKTAFQHTKAVVASPETRALARELGTKFANIVGLAISDLRRRLATESWAAGWAEGEHAHEGEPDQARKHDHAGESDQAGEPRRRHAQNQPSANPPRLNR